MIYLVIFNTLVSLCIVGYLLYRFFPYHIEANKTFWCHRTFSFTIMKRVSSNYSVGVLTIPIRNYKKTVKWDDMMFHTGKYKEYRKKRNKK